MLLLALDGPVSKWAAELQEVMPLSQPPPQNTRLEPEAGPVGFVCGAEP
jgi:hypothetical protein